MSKYIYSIHDYHAIKKAVIKIDGITVLSGENGSGKSTLSKWLYYIINGAENLDVYIYNSFIDRVLDMIRHLNMARRELDRNNGNANYSVFREGEMKLWRLKDNESPENIDAAITIFESALALFVKILSNYLNNKPSVSAKERILKYLEFELHDTDSIDDELEVFVEKQKRQIYDLAEQYTKDKNNRSTERFFSLLRSKYRIYDVPPVNIQLEEDNVKLFRKNKAGNLFNLNRAIYVDTPMAISEDFAYDNKFWDSLRDLMMYTAKDIHLSDGAHKLIRRIRKLIKGQVSVRKDDFNQRELRYIRDDGLDIKLDDVATGFKSFSYILRLLENGYLDDGTLLLIDEPEAHLHPAWIVEFARLLILLNKELGIKVVITSHNPDMVAAIQAIAKKTALDDAVHFYIAEQSENEFRYSYRDLGNEVEDIFKSFNIAYERIEQYGRVGI